MFFNFRSLIGLVGFMGLTRFRGTWGGRRSLSGGSRIGRTGVPLVFNGIRGGGDFIAGAGGGDPMLRLTGFDNRGACHR